MQLPPNAERVNFTIKGLVFSAPEPFVEGDIITAAEAAVLNQVFRENIRNNFASTVEKAKEEAAKSGSTVDRDTLQESLDKYIEAYEFGVGVRRAPGVSRAVDPVEAEARSIALSRIKEGLRAKGLQISKVGKERLDELVNEALAAHPQLYERAKAIIEARQAAIADLGM